MTRRLAYLFCVHCIIALSTFAASPSEVTVSNWVWPEIQPLVQSFRFRASQFPAVNLYIKSREGKPLYRLTCHVRGYQGDPGFDYSGDFECRLTSTYSADSYSTLLTDNPLQTRDWESRARFFAHEVSGKCGQYPEFGRVRHFTLRGMLLTLTVSNPTFGAGHLSTRLRSFDFTVQADPQLNVMSAIAEQVPYLPPQDGGNHCTMVRKMHVPGRIDAQYLEKFDLGSNFPELAGTERDFVIRPGPTEFRFADAPLPIDARVLEIPLKDVSGKIAYTLECSAYTMPVENGFIITRWGLSCGLFSEKGTFNLLSDSVDPYTRMNRSLILPEQLYGACGNYPEWGRTRKFRLRGFSLTLQLKDPVFWPVNQPPNLYRGGIQQLVVHVEVRSDPTALSPVALPPEYAFSGFLPGNQGCERVITIAREAKL